MKLLIAALLFLTLISCEPTFKEPQPVGKKTLSAFPGRLVGDYLAKDSSSVLTIGETTIIESGYNCEKFPKDSIKNYPQFCLRNKSIVRVISLSNNIDSLHGDSLALSNDSLLVFKYVSFPLFSIDSNGILKKYKGYFFLNTKYDGDGWTVRRLSLKKGILTLADIDENGVNNLHEIAELPEDSLAQNLELTKKQFKSFNKVSGNYSTTGEFIRLRRKY